jgi:hypothetical protein
VFKCKRSFNGEGVWFKVCLVAHGFTQQAGLDYHETFALVVKWETLCFIVRIATHKHWPILHLDVQTTFLNNFLSEEVHMERLVGFMEPEVEHKVCLFKCALYDSKQSPHA